MEACPGKRHSWAASQCWAAASLQRPRAQGTSEHGVSYGEQCHGELGYGELGLGELGYGELGHGELCPINNTRTDQLSALLGNEDGLQRGSRCCLLWGAMRMWALSKGAQSCEQLWGCLLLRNTGGAHGSPAQQCNKGQQEQLNSVNPGTSLAMRVNFCT